MNDLIDPAIVEKAAKAIDWKTHEYRGDSADWVPFCNCGWKASAPYAVSEFELHIAELVLEAAAPLIAANALADIRRRVESEREQARAAHQSARAQTDHFAHDYCRWVGHAEALTNTLRDIDTRTAALEAGLT